ncbi:hypothetical protein D3C72_1268190 [compost metagenome]
MCAHQVAGSVAKNLFVHGGFGLGRTGLRVVERIFGVRRARILRGDFRAAADAHAGVERHGNQRDFVGLPAGDAVHVHVAVARFLQLHIQDAIADRNVFADAVFHVLPDFICARAVAEANDSAAHAISADGHGLDDAHLVVPVVVHQNRAAVAQAVQLDGAGAVVQNLDAEPALTVFVFGRKRQLDGAFLGVDASHFHHARTVALCVQLFGSQRHLAFAGHVEAGQTGAGAAAAVDCEAVAVAADAVPSITHLHFHFLVPLAALVCRVGGPSTAGPFPGPCLRGILRPPGLQPSNACRARFRSTRPAGLCLARG